MSKLLLKHETSVGPLIERKVMPRSVTTKLSADGYVDGPATEFDATASYTFEASIEGKWFRWTGQRPEIAGDRARFYLRDGQPISRPEDMVAESTGIEPVRP